MDNAYEVKVYDTATVSYRTGRYSYSDMLTMLNGMHIYILSGEWILVSITLEGK